MADASGKVLLVGSIGLGNAGDVFRSLAACLGDAASRYPDGETGVRGYWIRWQEHNLKDSPQFLPSEQDVKLPGFKDTIKRTFYSLADGVSEPRFDNIGYADHAIESWGLFKGLRDDGNIPPGVRFQVSLPTPTAFVSGFIVFGDREQVEPAYADAMRREVERIVATIPPADLAIQWDVCYEIVGHDGGPRLHYDGVFEGTMTRLAALGGLVPELAELGFHLCYGDPGHRHIIEPESLQTSVTFANGICASSSRDVNWIHMAVPRSRSDDDYFRPLAKLRLRPETELYLGLVHHTDGVDGTAKRIATGRRFFPGFGLATECGFGRRPAETIPPLLQIHSEAARL